MKSDDTDFHVGLAGVVEQLSKVVKEGSFAPTSVMRPLTYNEYLA